MKLASSLKHRDTFTHTDYAKAREEKRPLVLEAARRLLASPEHPWTPELQHRAGSMASDAATFYALKRRHKGAPWWGGPSTQAEAGAIRALDSELRKT